MWKPHLNQQLLNSSKAEILDPTNSQVMKTSGKAISPSCGLDSCICSSENAKIKLINKQTTKISERRPSHIVKLGLIKTCKIKSTYWEEHLIHTRGKKL